MTPTIEVSEKPTNLLLCDSDPQMLDLMRVTLGWYGFQVFTQECSDGVMEELSRHPYDLLICDSLLRVSASPGCRGGLSASYKLCEHIRRSINPRIASVKILLLANGPLDLEDYALLRQYDVQVMDKFKSPEKWFEKINLIIKPALMN